MTLAVDLPPFAAVARAAERHPDRRAVVPVASRGGRPMTYRALVDRIRGVAGALREAGVRRGERIGVLASEGDRVVVAVLAVQLAGGVAVPLDPAFGPEERGRLLAAARLERVVIDGAVVPPAALRCHELGRLHGRRDAVFAPARDDEPALLAFTSGTAGRARAVVLSSAGLSYQLAALPRAIGVGEGDSTFLSLLGPHHLFELVCGWLAPLAAGATVVVAESALPHEVLAQAARERATHSCVVPALARLLTRGPRERHHRWTWLCGGAALDPAVAEELERRDLPCLVGYGLSEFSPVVATNRPDDRRAGTVGRPLAGVDVRLADGELEVRGESAMLGYLHEPAATRAAFTADGWLRTGDLASIDDDGFLRIEGRAGDLVVLESGKKVHPDEVEPLLGTSALFRDACALGLRGPRGPELGVVVVPAAALSARDAAREVARLTARLAPWKRPTRVVVRDAPLPRTATWKVRRRALAAEIA